MKTYKYRPVRFYVTIFAATWICWLWAILFNEGFSCTIGLFLGLIAPATVAIITVFSSKDDLLISDFKRKIFSFYKLKPVNLFVAVVAFFMIITSSILLSVLFGQTIDQFAFTKDFSFSGAGIGSALSTILMASIIEEIGWRGYGEDSIANYCSWFTESVIFGIIWSLWHLPLFWIPDTYQYGLRMMGAGYMLNFFFSVIPLGFLTTWVYVENGRSMLACVIFHLFVNFMQERIALTPQTKCIETIVVTIAAFIIVLIKRDMFFETKHVGALQG